MLWVQATGTFIAGLASGGSTLHRYQLHHEYCTPAVLSLGVRIAPFDHCFGVAEIHWTAVVEAIDSVRLECSRREEEKVQYMPGRKT